MRINSYCNTQSSKYDTVRQFKNGFFSRRKLKGLIYKKLRIGFLKSQKNQTLEKTLFNNNSNQPKHTPNLKHPYNCDETFHLT